MNWKANATGEFQVRSGQEIHRCMNPIVSWHKSIRGSFNFPRQFCCFVDCS